MEPISQKKSEKKVRILLKIQSKTLKRIEKSFLYPTISPLLMKKTLLWIGSIVIIAIFLVIVRKYGFFNTQHSSGKSEMQTGKIQPKIGESELLTGDGGST
ncbi:MAG: hypothetical protein LBG59_03785 [Candidatus Peribacteria bacterium]|nr:hypothetical protein [Candidatus Peribacteria bacterium]